MKFNAMATVQAAEKEYGLGKGEFYKLREGTNKIRLMSDGIPYQSIFKGQKNFKFVTWIYDYTDSQVKLYFVPMTIMRAIGSLQTTEGFEFDECPMPYDLIITAVGAGTKEAKYQVNGARANTPVPDTALQQMVEKKSVEEVVAKMREKDGATRSLLNTPTEQTQENTPLDEIPFA